MRLTTRRATSAWPCVAATLQYKDGADDLQLFFIGIGRDGDGRAFDSTPGRG